VVGSEAELVCLEANYAISGMDVFQYSE